MLESSPVNVPDILPKKLHKASLLASTATWRVIAADMPLGLVVYHDAGRKWGLLRPPHGDAREAVVDPPPR